MVKALEKEAGYGSTGLGEEELDTGGEGVEKRMIKIFHL